MDYSCEDFTLGYVRELSKQVVGEIVVACVKVCLTRGCESALFLPAPSNRALSRTNRPNYYVQGSMQDTGLQGELMSYHVMG